MELFERAAGLPPVSKIALRRQAGQVDNPPRGGYWEKMRCNLHCVLAGRGVINGQDDNMVIAEVVKPPGKQMTPAVGAGIAGSRQAPGVERSGIFPGFGQEDGLGCQHAGRPGRHARALAEAILSATAQLV